MSNVTPGNTENNKRNRNHKSNQQANVSAKDSAKNSGKEFDPESTEDIEIDFDNLPKNEALDEAIRSLRGEPINLEGMPEGAWASEEKRHFISVTGIRLAEYGRVHDYESGSLKLKLNDPVVIDVPDKGLTMAWVARPPMRFDNSELKLRLEQIMRKATEDDLLLLEKKESMEKRGYERSTAAISRMNLPMDVLRVEYTLDRRKAIVYFAADKRVDFRTLLKELVHDLKARVELRQVGARDRTKQIGAIGPCGEETCCSRFLDKFHGVSIKMAKDQGLSLKPTKTSGMCGRLKCCLAYEHLTYVEGLKSVPRVGKCVKCKSSGSCGTVRDVDVPRQTVLVEMEDGTMTVLPASEVVTVKTLRRENSHSNANEKVVATTDTDSLVDQIKQASGQENTEKKAEKNDTEKKEEKE